eukprot:6177212-Pleurochrysis_carterae.AAC.3
MAARLALHACTAQAAASTCDVRARARARRHVALRLSWRVACVLPVGAAAQRTKRSAGSTGQQQRTSNTAPAAARSVAQRSSDRSCYGSSWQIVLATAPLLRLCPCGCNARKQGWRAARSRPRNSSPP